MKFVHLSDLHIGRYLNNFSLLNDQEYILGRILEIIEEEKPDAVFIAGDVYDKSTPSAEAVSVLNKFLTSVSELGTELFVIYGNHDSADKLAFASSLMKSNVHFSKVFDGSLEKVHVGNANVYMLPFIKPISVKKAFRDVEGIEELIGNDYSAAAKYVIDKSDIDKDEKNILICHQFITGAALSGSEEVTSVGGMDNISADVFDMFDYVAAGHIHKKQRIGRNIHYCGSPLKYSVSEAGSNKYVTVVDIDDDISVKEIPLVPLRDLRTIESLYEDIMDMEESDDYISIELTDNELKYNAFDNIQHKVFKNILSLKYKNRLGEGTASTAGMDRSSLQERSMNELFEKFYSEIMGAEMNKEMSDTVLELCEEAEAQQ